MRTPCFAVRVTAVGFLIIASLAAPMSALAGWSGSPVAVATPPHRIISTASCPDGHAGALVAWMEDLGSGQAMLSAKHLLPTGDLDSAWPAQGRVVVASTSCFDRQLEAISDGSSGMFLCWTGSYGEINVSHVGPDGAIEPGWSASGINVGNASYYYESPTDPWYPAPRVASDGVHGIFIVWTTFEDNGVYFAHMNPDASSGNWPGPGFVPFPSLNSPELGPTYLWPSVAAGPGGSVYVAAARCVQNGDSFDGEWKLRRLLPGGVAAPGWPATGLTLGTFDANFLNSNFSILINGPRAPLIDLASDGDGGVYVALATPTVAASGAIPLDGHVYRLLADGTSSAAWPAGGIALAMDNPYGYFYSRIGAGLRADGGTSSGVFVRSYYTTIDATDNDYYRRCHDGVCDGNLQVRVDGHDATPDGNGGLWATDFNAGGNPSPYSAGPYVEAMRWSSSTGWPGWSESPSIPGTIVYLDATIAATGDGGAVLFYARTTPQSGLFARRMGWAGEITGVAPHSPPSSLTIRDLRFVRGSGVRARLEGIAGSRIDVALFDVAGRRLAAESVAAGQTEITLPGTRDLPAAIYFVRSQQGANAAGSRVVVLP